MTHKENIQEILKGCHWEDGLCGRCRRGLSEYLKAVKVELEFLNNILEYCDEFHSKIIKARIKVCEEAIELGEKHET